MSASSNWVTCGMLTQLACRRGPEIFWIRDSGLSSIGPNFAKSTTGTRGSAAPQRAPRRSSAHLTNALTSSSVTRPFGPEPCTRARSTPSSRANLRTDGLACARANLGSSTRGRAADTGAATRRRCCRGTGCRFDRPRGSGSRRGRRSGAGAGDCVGASRRSGRRGLDERDQVALRHPRAPLHLQLAHRPGHRRRHLHRRLVGLERDQRALDGDAVAGLDQHLDDLDVSGTRRCRAPHFDELLAGHDAAPRAQTVTGLGLSGSIPNVSMAATTVARSS